MMDFTLTERQRAVASLAAEILGREDDPWQELAKAGLLDGDLGVLDTAILLTEIGQRAPSMKALSLAGAPAIREPSDPQPATPATTITDGKITGVKVGVPYAAEADRILVPTSAGVALVDPRAPGVALTRTPSSTGEPEYTLRLDQTPADDVLGGADRVRDLYRLAVAGACALADGALAGALALTRDHVATREQFGRPLAAFQAVSQQIADVYIASRTLHLATLSACWRLGEDRDPGADLGVAAYWCAEHAPRSVRVCHHLHGGLGMDVTYPLHRFSSLISDLVRFLGGADYRLDLCSST